MPGLPVTRDITFIPAVTTIPAVTMNNIQDCIVALFASGGGTLGDGSDGAIICDGTTPVPFATLASNVYTMTRDCYCRSLTVTGASTVLITNGFRVFVNGTLITAAGGKISASGANAIGQTGGVAVAVGIVLGSVAGGNGGTSTTGFAGTSTTYGYSGNGSAGGAGSAGAGGAGGTLIGGVPAVAGSPHLFAANSFGYVVGAGIAGGFGGNIAAMVPLCGGAGGGGGGFGGGNGGGGGAGSGILCIAARNIVLANASDLIAKGGNGAAGVGTNAGGGGGGGGGTLLLVYGSLVVTSGTLGNATNAPGGAGGAGTGTGVAGTAGVPGTVFAMQPWSQPVGASTAGGGPHEEKGFSAMTSGSSGNTHDFLDVVFGASFAAATGATGYYVECMLSLTSPTAPGIVLEGIVNKTTTGCRLVFSGDFDGEVRWRAYA